MKLGRMNPESAEGPEKSTTISSVVLMVASAWVCSSTRTAALGTVELMGFLTIT